MSIIKKVLKVRPACQVTFKLAKEQVESAKAISLVGDFNNWDATATPMKKQKDGSYSTTVELALEQEYQFRYLIDGQIWLNEQEADKQVTTQFGDSENSVISL